MAQFGHDLSKSFYTHQAPLALASGLGLLIVLAGGMFFLPPGQLMLVLASLFVLGYYFAQTTVALVAVLVLRVVVDMVWWMQGLAYGLNMMQVFSATVFLVSATVFFTQIRRVEDHPCFKWVLIYFVLLVIAAFRAETAFAGVDGLVRYSCPFLLMFLITSYFDTSRIRRLALLLILLAGIIPLLISVYHFLNGQMNSYSLAGYHRLLGGYKNLHTHALMMVQLASLSMFWLALERDRFRRGLLVALCAGFCASLYFSYVRTGYLGLAIFLGAFLYFSRKQKALAAFGLFFIIMLLLSPEVRERMAFLVDFFDSGEVSFDRRMKGSGRWGLWTMSLHNFFNRSLWDQILGLGLGGDHILTVEWVKGHQFWAQSLDPHNDYLLLLYQAGPIVVVCYLACLWQVYESSRAVMRMSTNEWVATFGAYMAALCVYVLVVNMVSNSLVGRASPGWTFWSLAGVLFAEHRHLLRQQDKLELGPKLAPMAS